MKCTSCGKDCAKGTTFDCPGCSRKKMTRCLQCKKLNIAYSCTCGFEGP